jgi:hypothetical protein
MGLPLMAHNAIALGTKLLKSQAVKHIGASLFANKLQRNQNKKLAQYTHNKNIEMWKMQNKYNSPKEQMARYTQAGLNPNLIYGKGTPGNAQTMPQYQALESSGQMFGQSIAGLQGLLDIENKQQDLQQNKQRTLFEEVFKMPLGQMTLEQGLTNISAQQAQTAGKYISNEIDRIKKGMWDKNINPNESIVIREMAILIKELVEQNKEVAGTMKQTVNDLINFRLPRHQFPQGMSGHIQDLGDGLKEIPELGRQIMSFIQYGTPITWRP